MIFLKIILYSVIAMCFLIVMTGCVKAILIELRKNMMLELMQNVDIDELIEAVEDFKDMEGGEGNERR